jgi:hypothetical protein
MNSTPEKLCPDASASPAPPAKPRPIEPPLPEFCPACGRRFKPHQWRIVADWFRSGTPPDESIVHYGCRHKPREQYKIRANDKPTSESGALS